MATTSAEKRRCSNAKCEKGAGIFTCNGCQQSFCRKHSDEHRTELATQMDSISQNYDLFRRDMDTDNGSHSLLSRIDIWERESVMRIQQAAEKARRDLREIIDQSKQVLISNLDQVSKEIQSNRESEDYTEGDLAKWIHQLDQYRQDLDGLIGTYLIDDDHESSIIRLVKVRKNKSVRVSNKNLRMKRDVKWPEKDERIILSEDGLVVVSSGLQPREYATFMGTGCYSIGKQSVPFRIEKVTGSAILFGIISSSHTDPTTIFTSTNGVYGWYAGHLPVENSSFGRGNTTECLRDGDEITLLLNCENNEICFNHYRTVRVLRLYVDPQRCPLPWKIVVVFYNNGDCVRILQ